MDFQKKVMVGIVGFASFANGLMAGDLDSTGSLTDAAGQQYTIEQIHTKLTTGVDATKQTTFTEPTAGPTVATGKSLDDVYTAITDETDLTAGNIKDGVEIFGVTGTMEIDPNTSSGDAVAGDILLGKKAWVDGSEVTGTLVSGGVLKTGQTTSYATGDDGDLQKGTAHADTRFTDHGDGTVTDNSTGLIWLKNANADGTKNWADALEYCNELKSGDAGLSDSSSAGDWRLPNRRELESLVNIEYSSPTISNAAGTAIWTEGDPFTGVQSNYYWSSSTFANDTTRAWVVHMRLGGVYRDRKTSTYYVWPVRGGQ